jgi:hypothetical protein
MGTTAISVLAQDALLRCEEFNPATPVFWTTDEAYSGVIEAISDLLLLIGRPTQYTSQTVTIAPNTPWQTMPAGLLCISDVIGSYGQIYKQTQFDTDFLQSSWGSGWQNDIGPTIKQWWPLGFNMFGVHPSVSMPEQVTVTGIQVPTSDAWPYTGNELVPFEDSLFIALEEYAAHYLRFKEQGNEFFGSLALYKSYLAQAKRYTQIQDRRDGYIFDSSVGAPGKVSPTTQR